ncbi:MAG TPA: DNA primase [Candidatus Azoamicus sp. MARI]
MYYKLNDFLYSFNVQSVISKFISLKDTKNGYLALCPFHLDKTPSFFLSASTKRYYCFACHKRGNVLTFIMEYKNLSFNSSLDLLSSYIPLGYKVKKKPKSFELVNVVSDVYFKNLKKNYLLNKNVYAFFDKRNISFTDIDIFKLGLSESNVSWLSDILFNLGYSVRHLHFSGLFFLKNGFYFDRFRYRIIFPIRNIYGQVIAFGGRSLDDKFKPKYINSSETTFFSKRSEFYGLYESFSSIKCSTIIIVEGYIDVITLHKYGIRNVIAVLGTVFSKEHFKKISSIYKNIIFCYDGDNAGRIATERTAFFCLQYLQYAMSISFVLLPMGHDPDSFIRCGFKNRFLDLLKKPIYILDLIFNRLAYKFNLNRYKDKISFFSEVFKVIDKSINLYLKKVLFFYFFKKFFEHENIIFDYINFNLVAVKKNFICPMGLRAAYFLCKNKNYILKININKFLYCNNLDFFSDINIFFETLILLRRNTSIDLKIINNLIFNKIDLNKLFSFNVDFDTDDIFKSFLNKIYDICS